MELWFNINMTIGFIALIMFIIDIVVGISQRYDIYALIGMFLTLFFITSGSFYFIVSIIWMS